MKTFVIKITLLLLTLQQVHANKNVIILFDKDLFEYTGEDKNALVKPDSYLQVANKLKNEIKYRLTSIFNNLSFGDQYTFYAIKQSPYGFFAGRLSMDFENIDLLSSYVNSTWESGLSKYENANLYDLVARHSDMENPGQFFESTIVIVFSKAILTNLLVTHKRSMFELVEMSEHRFNNKHEFEYAKWDTVYTGGFAHDTVVSNSCTIPVFEYGYQLSRKNTNIFNSPKDAPFIFKYDRKTIPGSENIRLYPISDSTMTIRMEAGSKANIQWCKLLTIEGSDSHYKIRGDELPQQFDQHNTGYFSALFAPNAIFPFPDLTRDWIVLNGADPTDIAYNGTMVIRYNLHDPVYSHAVFNDTIHFKLEVASLIHMQAGLLKRLLIDNAVLVKYANKLDAHKEWTQEELASQYTINIKIVVGVLVVLLIILVALVKRFLIDKKRLTLANLIPFKM